MNAEEFWTVFMEENIFNSFEKYIKFFSEPRDAGLDEYDYVEVCLEVSGHMGDAGRIEEVAEFAKLVKEKSPEIYYEAAMYFAERLVPYFYSIGQRELAKPYIEDLIENCVEACGSLINVLRTLEGYDDVLMLDEIAMRCTERIRIAEDSIYGSSQPFSGIVISQKLFSMLEDSIQHETAHSILTNECPEDLGPLAHKLPEVMKFATDATKSMLEYKDEELFLVIELRFMQWMKPLGYSPILSTRIIHAFCNYWQKAVGSGKFEDLLACPKFNEVELRKACYTSFYADEVDVSDAAILVWGAPYVYDFLFEQGVVTASERSEAISGIYQVKLSFMDTFMPNLFKVQFLNDWKLPPSGDKIQQETESILFSRSREQFRNKKTSNSQFVSSLDENNSDLQNLSSLIKSALPIIPAQKSMLDMMMEEYDGAEYEVGTPIVNTEVKIGRNEKCPCGSGKKYKKCCMD